MELTKSVFVVSVFGRGHWLAVELKRKGLDVTLIDVSAAMGSWGPEDSPVQLRDAVLVGEDAREAISIPRGPMPTILSRRGCDLAPVDPLSEAGRLRLLSFVWSDHVERFRRLEGALQLAAREPVVVDRAPLGTWLAERLEEPCEPGVLTVVWHSIVMQYVSDAEKLQLADLLARASTVIPVAHLAMEAPIAPYFTKPELRLDGRLLGTVRAHGVPVTLAPLQS